MDAFDVITDPQLVARTASLRRRLALLLAAQKAYDSWYSFEDPEELAKAIKSAQFDPSKVMLDGILEMSSSIDSELVRILRDVGVGSPQIGIPGIGVGGANSAPSPGHPQASQNGSGGEKKRIFGR